ncbi:cyclic di-GMP phosphodiesterase response regulator RpfG [Clostridium homopropionicum DSM 5847]|uniref:Cyclic di-GMP phosphodiesterase response regulator RpfG n=1 Tax=Clostridium homopropionicum DSM 5847 TaxID=1121318 RepID=A0A0L6ZB35_9CLOT|nr:PAS domain S-box protein [Clostridium homopropionicum]KOA20013.1 cyclic di-GMP phosphodiesterase response regulator RpfG [Clostridium homopropionicum DSM 5847]SFG64729.1 diguanylate cyclase with PAS/PAC sensor [Clostridium homopropionicum]
MNNLSNSGDTIKVLQSLISDVEIPSNPPEEMMCIEGFERIYNSLLDIRKACMTIGNGELNYQIKSKGYLPGALKNLQASMQHLTWKTKAIASGDFTQKVDFLGEFSEAFNNMIEQLESSLNNYKAAQKELMEAKEHFEQIFKTSPDATLITRLKDGLIINVNHGFLDFLGYEQAEVIGEKIFDINFYEDKSDRHIVLNELSKNGYCENIEVIFRRKTGEKLTGLFSARIITLEDVPHIISVIRNITDRKNSEEKLKKSEEMYRVLAENITDVIWILDPETMNFIYVSPSVYNLRGYTAEEVMAEPMDAALTEEGAKYVREVTKKGLENYITGKEKPDKYYIDEIQQPCKDGSLIWTEVITTYYTNKETGKVQVRGVTRDITERKAAEKKIKESEEKYRLLFENAVEAIVVIQDYKIKIWNPMIENLSGYSKEELTSMIFLDFIHTDDRKIALDNHLKRLAGEELEGKYRFRLMRKDNNIRWIEMNLIKILWEGKAATLNFLTDITDRIKKEKEILFLSYHDQLTGLYNRRFYEEELIRIDTESNLPITVVMADVNGLKLTNDAFGHLLGDRLLTEFADIMKKTERPEDIIARIGGDEFILVLPKTDSKGAERIVKDITTLASEKKIENLILSISFGWDTKKHSWEDISKISTQAENYMYKHKLDESPKMKSETIKLITKTLYENNKIEEHHSENVGRLCERIAFAMGMNTSDASELKIAGQMHDIGKIGISNMILHKQEKLNDLEYLEVKKHPEVGYHILRAANEFSEIAEIVLAHHERIDGKGYPKGIKGEEISLKSRIISIADAYDGMTSFREYKACLSKDEAIRELKNNANRQFDADIAKIFVEKVLHEVW